MMKTVIPILCIAAIAVGIYFALRSHNQSSEGARDYTMICTAPDCGHAFGLSRTEMRGYPRGANGEGFKCPRCSAMAAQIARRCERCTGPFLPEARLEARCAECVTREGQAGPS